MMNKDYVFHVKWEDRHKQLHRVGFLAQLDEYFYLIIKDEETAETAYKNGFIGIPGFKQEEVYRSKELFDFFKSRILQKTGSNLCEELASTGAKSMIDSYSVEKVSDKIAQKYRGIIIDTYELQEKKKILQEERELGKINNGNKKLNSDELIDKN